MKNINSKIIAALILTTLFTACNDDDSETTSQEDTNQQQRVGFEILQIQSPTSILVWINNEPLTQEQYNAIALPQDWRKNEPREGIADSGRFLRSPDAAEEGEFTVNQHFGYEWLFNAEVIENNVPLPSNEEALLTGRYIAKYHEISFKAGRTLSVLVSPEGEEFVLISRDANRSTDTAVIPDGWQLLEKTMLEDITLTLPNPTLNIRAENNQDSWQGPVVFSN